MMCLYICVDTIAYVHMCVWKSEDNMGLHSLSAIHHFIFETVSLTGVLLASCPAEQMDPSASVSTVLRYITVHVCLFFMGVFLGVKHKSSCL